MSYILEALRRSEQERARGETPDVTTQHELPPLRAMPGGRRNLFAWLLGGALLANAVVLAIWLLPDRAATDRNPATATAPSVAVDRPTAPGPTANVAPTPAAPATETGAGSAPAARAQMPATAAPAADPAIAAPGDAPGEAAIAASRDENAEARVAAATTADTGAEAPAEAPTPATAEPAAPVAIRDLPERIQRSIPTLEFATHIFGDAPRYREVTINGRRYAEGERVEGMLLAEITETGVVFDYQGYRFEVGVLEDWDY